MADEVVIRLRGSSAQLEAALQRLSNNMDQLGVKSKVVNTGIQENSRRTSAAIDNQNKSFTLMVAKLALVTFAVQTMANIFQNTFGAVLKNIDDFNLAAIGTAAAITSITTETNRPGIDVFNQNLKAAKQTFEELELVAADFFANGQELQLAFNTLAQRGVVVRQEEFRILGQLTDQIKLLTGGQASEIQIQQELRSILDGNVRTTSAFGKSLQARGVDIAQLQRELQATGSIKVFEPFLTGLDSASGAVKRTLSSVTSTFGSLASIIGRNVFEDTFDKTVALITRINNLLIDQRAEFEALGRVIVSNVSAGAQRLLNVFIQISNVLGDIVADDLLRLLAVITLITKLSSGPVRVFLLMGVALASLTGDIDDVDKAFNILIGTMRILLKTFSDVVKDSLTGFQQLARKLNFSIATKTIKDLKVELAGLDNLLARSGTSGDERDAALKRREQLLVEISSAEQELFDAAAKSVAAETQLRIEALEVLEKQNILSKQGKEELERLRGIAKDIPFDDSISKSLSDLEAQVNSIVDGLGLAPVSERLSDILKDLKTELGKPNRLDFAETSRPSIADSRVQEAELARSRAAFDANLSLENKARENFFQQEIRRIKLTAAERTITGQQSFQAELAAKQESIRLDILQLEAQKEIVRERAKQDRAIISDNLSKVQGPTKIQAEQDAFVKVAQSLSKETSDILALTQKINELNNQGQSNALEAAKQTTEEYRKVNRLLQDRNSKLLAAGGLTNEERAANINLESSRLREDFAADNQANPQQVAAFNKQQNRLDFLASVQPQIDAFTKAVDDTFQTLINAIVDGSFEFRDLANTLSKDLIQSGLQEFIAQAKDAVVKGFEKIFEGLGSEAAAKSAQALALGIGILLAVLSRAGNDGDFTATGGSGGGSGVSGSRQVQGIIGGDTSIPIAEINIGLQEALIPTNSLLSQIERNTRSLAGLNVDIDPGALQAAFSAQMAAFFQQSILQNP